MITVFAVPTMQILRRLFTHFAEFGPIWISVGAGRRREVFLAHLGSVALRSPLVLNCIFAATAADLAKYHNGGGEEGLGRAIFTVRSL